jgi:crotonobetaine/carnitine-CoA ligase
MIETMAHYPDWYNPDMPTRDECVIGALLDKVSTEAPDRVFAVFDDGTEWTYAETRGLVRDWAQGLQELGIEKSDSVLIWLPNGPDIVRAWFAVTYLGAIYAPVNLAYRGELLRHVIDNSGASVMIVHPGLVDRLKGLDLPNLRKVIVLGDVPDVELDQELLTRDCLDGDGAALEPVEEVQPWDTMAIIYTSGTTGPSKGVVCSYLHYYTVGIMAVGFIEPHERCMISMPLFHLGATGGVVGVLARHASIGVVEGFSTDKFWDLIRSMNCAVHCGMIGSVIAFLHKRPAAGDDKDNPLRRCLVAPVDDRIRELAERHDFEYFTGFGMSEAPIPLVSEINPTQSGYCGRERDGVECRIVDENDIEVPAGKVGELVVRADLPWALNSGYVRNAEATVEAWRNGWYHTGDAFRKDDNGRYFFVDRIKDSIRRRGENISSLEVEKVVLQYPDVLDAAVIPVPSEFSEDEVMTVVQPKPGRTIDPVDLIEFLVPQMAHFMVPRYVRYMDALPKTPTNKVQKTRLRKEGVTDDTWDREAAGIRLKREKLSK